MHAECMQWFTQERLMYTITIRHVPEDLKRALKQSAKLHHRSLNGEVLASLQQTFTKKVKANGHEEVLMMSESSLGKDWNLLKEDKAWKSL